MNNADIAWMLLSTALVLLMTPALAFFYGGLVRSKNALNTMMMSFVALGSGRGGVGAARLLARVCARQSPPIGSLSFAGLRGVGMEAQGTIPHLLFMAFQGTFAIITPALISGAVVERMRFNAYLAFIVLWVSRSTRRSRTGCGAAAFWPRWARSTSPAARSCTSMPHRPRSSRRWSSARARITAVTRSCRTTFRSRCSAPGLLWFGWFGFNAGSALSAGTTATLAFTNTLLAPAATLAAWTLIDMAARRHASPPSARPPPSSSASSSSRPRPATSVPSPAIVMGALGAIPSYFALIYRAKTKLDDSLDVVAAHGLGGATGAILTGVFADAAWSGGAERAARRPSRRRC